MKFRALTQRGLANIVEINNAFPLCLIPSCKERIRHYEALCTICECSEFRWYKVLQNNQNMLNFDTYIIYVYEGC